MICPKCNNEIPEESVFCPKCGFALNGNSNVSVEINNTNKKSFKINSKSIIAIILALFVIGGGATYVIYNSQPSTKYAKAEKALADKNYKKAVELYTAAGIYEDAPNKLIEANYGLSYEDAKKLMEDENYDDAIEKFKESNSFEDADDLIIQCHYLQGIQLMEAGDIDGATQCFKTSINYKDSNDKIVEMGQNLVINGDYEKGENILAYSKNGAKDPYAQYAKGKLAYDKKNYSEAATAFEGAGDTIDAKDLYVDSVYNDAQSKFSSKSYSAASNLFGKVKDYKDAGDMVLACQLMDAKSKMDEGNLNQAKEALSKISTDYSYNGVKVTDLIAKLDANSKWLDICGKWTSTKGQMRSTQVGSYYDYWWYRDFGEGDVNMDVRVILNSDGTVTVKASSSVPVYLTYSSISSGVKEKKVEVKINEKMSDFGTVKFDDVTSVKIGKDGMTVNYKVVDRTKDVYFNYIYNTDVTYGKRTTKY